MSNNASSISFVNSPFPPIWLSEASRNTSPDVLMISMTTLKSAWAASSCDLTQLAWKSASLLPREPLVKWFCDTLSESRENVGSWELARSCRKSGGVKETPNHLPSVLQAEDPLNGGNVILVGWLAAEALELGDGVMQHL